jgi:RND family efflux transporter MFP subunit
MRAVWLVLVLLGLPWPGRATLPVETVALSEVVIYPEYEAPAEVLSLNDSELSAQVMARVRRIGVLVGDMVKPGEVLLELESRDFDLELRRARAKKRSLEAQFELAKVQLRRAKALQKTRSASEELLNQRQAEVEELKAQLDEQEAAIEQARFDLTKCRVRAPFKALVVRRLAHVGELATPGSPLLRVQDLEQIELSAKVQTQNVAALRAAASPLFIARGQEYPLLLRAVVPRVDPRQRSQEVRLTFAEQTPLVGTAGLLVWRNSNPHVPPNLLVHREGRLGIFVDNGGSADFVPVPDARPGRPARISLPLSTPIVREGRFALKPGSPIGHPE